MNRDTPKHGAFTMPGNGNKSKGTLRAQKKNATNQSPRTVAAVVTPASVEAARELLNSRRLAFQKVSKHGVPEAKHGSPQLEADFVNLATPDDSDRGQLFLDSKLRRRASPDGSDSYHSSVVPNLRGRSGLTSFGVGSNEVSPIFGPRSSDGFYSSDSGDEVQSVLDSFQGAGGQRRTSQLKVQRRTSPRKAQREEYKRLETIYEEEVLKNKSLTSQLDKEAKVNPYFDSLKPLFSRKGGSSQQNTSDINFWQSRADYFFQHVFTAKSFEVNYSRHYKDLFVKALMHLKPDLQDKIQSIDDLDSLFEFVKAKFLISPEDSTWHYQGVSNDLVGRCLEIGEHYKRLCTEKFMYDDGFDEDVLKSYVIEAFKLERVALFLTKKIIDANRENDTDDVITRFIKKSLKKCSSSFSSEVKDLLSELSFYYGGRSFGDEEVSMNSFCLTAANAFVDSAIEFYNEGDITGDILDGIKDQILPMAYMCYDIYIANKYNKAAYLKSRLELTASELSSLRSQASREGEVSIQAAAEVQSQSSAQVEAGLLRQKREFVDSEYNEFKKDGMNNEFFNFVSRSIFNLYGIDSPDFTKMHDIRFSVEHQDKRYVQKGALSSSQLEFSSIAEQGVSR